MIAGREGRNEWEAANRVSQRLSYSSTHRNAGGLNFRVRDGYGCDPAAMAALTPIRGIEPRVASDRLVDAVTVCMCDPDCAWTRSASSMRYDWWLRPISARRLNTSLPRCVHLESIDLVFYEWPQRCLFSRWVSGLDAFSRYPVWRSCPATLSRTTGTPVATIRSSSRTIRTFPSGTMHPQ